MKLKHCMSLSVMDRASAKPIAVRPPFLALPCIVCLIFKHPVVGEATLLRQKTQQTHYYFRIATKPAKTYQNMLL